MSSAAKISLADWVAFIGLQGQEEKGERLAVPQATELTVKLGELRQSSEAGGSEVDVGELIALACLLNPADAGKLLDNLSETTPRIGFARHIASGVVHNCCVIVWPDFSTKL